MATEAVDIRDIKFVTDRVGWVAVIPNGGADLGIYVTTDGGRTWHPQTLPEKHLTINSLSFSTEKEGWAGGIRGYGTSVGEESHALVLHTQDGGVNWRTSYTGQKSTICDQIFFSDPLHGWLLIRGDLYDSMYRTNDGGKSWKESLRVPAKNDINLNKE